MQDAFFGNARANDLPTKDNLCDPTGTRVGADVVSEGPREAAACEEAAGRSERRLTVSALSTLLTTADICEVILRVQSEPKRCEAFGGLLDHLPKPRLNNSTRVQLHFNAPCTPQHPQQILIATLQKMAARLTRSVPSGLFRSQSLRPSSLASPPAQHHQSPYARPQFPTSDLRTLRPFSSTPAAFASEAPRDPFEHRANWQSEVPLFERLQNHPECMEAIERLAETVKVSRPRSSARLDFPRASA